MKGRPQGTMEGKRQAMEQNSGVVTTLARYIASYNVKSQFPIIIIEQCFPLQYFTPI